MARYGLEGKFVTGYIGTHGTAHCLEAVIEVEDQIRNQEGGDQFRFILMGNGARKEALIRQARDMGLDNILFVDSVPKAEVVRYWSLLDVSIIHLKKTPLFTTVIPSKLFECMGMGIPVLHGVRGESAGIVEKEGAGLLFEPENSQALCEGLWRLQKDPGLYGRLSRNCLTHAPRYARQDLARRMLNILREAAL